MSRLTIGSRGSKLALWQAEYIRSRILKEHPALEVGIEIIRTTGDKLQEVALSKIGGKGVFVKEIEQALLEKRIDLAVHSLKDVPTELPNGLELSIYLEREDPRDAFLSSSTSSWRELPQGAVIGTSSLRRAVQLRALRDDLEIRPVRGNVDTRLRKMDDGGYAALILARAGLVRLGLAARVACPFEIDEMVPAVGQGALALETRVEDISLTEMLTRLDDRKTRLCVVAERVFLAQMGGGCQVPLGAHAAVDGHRAHFSAFVAGPVSGRFVRATGSCAPEDLSAKAKSVARELQERGAGDLLKEVPK